MKKVLLLFCIFCDRFDNAHKNHKTFKKFLKLLTDFLTQKKKRKILGQITLRIDVITLIVMQNAFNCVYVSKRKKKDHPKALKSPKGLQSIHYTIEFKLQIAKIDPP